jgi:hypothetical protein
MPVAMRRTSVIVAKAITTAGRVHPGRPGELQQGGAIRAGVLDPLVARPAHLSGRRAARLSFITPPCSEGSMGGRGGRGPWFRLRMRAGRFLALVRTRRWCRPILGEPLPRLHAHCGFAGPGRGMIAGWHWRGRSETGDVSVPP